MNFSDAYREWQNAKQYSGDSEALQRATERLLLALERPAFSGAKLPNPFAGGGKSKYEWPPKSVEVRLADGWSMRVSAAKTVKEPDQAIIERVSRWAQASWQDERASGDRLGIGRIVPPAPAVVECRVVA